MTEVYVVKSNKRLSIHALLILSSFFLAGGGQQAMAACTTLSSMVDLGSTSSLALSTSTPRASGSGGLSCDGALQLLTSGFIRATIVNSSFTLTNASYSIPFTVYSNNGYTAPMSTGQMVDFPMGNLLALGGAGVTIPIYVQTNPGVEVPAGTYTGNVTLRWYWAICTLGVANLCAWDRSPGLNITCILVCSVTAWGEGVIANVQVNLTITKSCQITSLPDVDFGTQALISQFTPVTQNVGVQCTLTEGYTLSFGNGANYSSPWRQMASGANRIRYKLLRGDTGGSLDPTVEWSAIGTGAQQLFPLTAVIDETQSNVPAGTYVDDVVLTISY